MINSAHSVNPEENGIWWKILAGHMVDTWIETTHQIMNCINSEMATVKIDTISQCFVCSDISSMMYYAVMSRARHWRLPDGPGQVWTAVGQLDWLFWLPCWHVQQNLPARHGFNWKSTCPIIISITQLWNKPNSIFLAFLYSYGRRPTLYKAAFFQTPPYSTLYTAPRQCRPWDF